jgi:hypothetical protein
MSGDTRDAALAVGLVGAFATLVTVHVATLFGLARGRHLGQALGGLLLPPLAPCWALTRGMPARAVAWFASAALYVALLVLAR